MQIRTTLALAALLAAGPLSAAWQENGAPIAPFAQYQVSPVVALDGAGGMIGAWADNREGAWRLYAQRVSGFGEPLWASDGVRYSGNSGDTIDFPVIAPAPNGAYLAWVESNSQSGLAVLHAQFVDLDGYPMWGSAPVEISNVSAISSLLDLAIVATDDGGAMVSWTYVYAPADHDIFAMKLSVSGPAWPVGGFAISAALDMQTHSAVAPLPGGGAVFVWEDTHYSAYGDIYARALDADGFALFGWYSPVPVADGAGGQYNPQVASDGQGGAFVVWEEFSGADVGIGFNRIMHDGSLPIGSIGELLTPISGNQWSPRIVEGDGGVFVAWQDDRDGNEDVYLQRLTTGHVSAFSPEGLAICVDPGTQHLEGIVADGEGGAIVVWDDSRTDIELDLHAQRVRENGWTAWQSNGRLVARDVGPTAGSAFTSDGSGGLLALWSTELIEYHGIRMQRIERSGYWGYPAPQLVSAPDAPGDQGGRVRLSWDASRLDNWSDDGITSYTLWRALPVQPRGASSTENWRELSLAPAGQRAEPVLRSQESGDRTIYWELIETVEPAQLPGYSRTVATVYDSTGVDPALHDFQIIAHGYSEASDWFSGVVVGYSVDNLAPVAPINLRGDAISEPQGLELRWSPNVESDLAHYVVHRGTEPDFPVDPSTFVAATADTSYHDEDWSQAAGFWYKVSAVDAHENRGAFALLEPDQVNSTGGDAPPSVTRLLRGYPNPFNPATTLGFDLAAPGEVRLVIHDAAGRAVRVLVDEALPSGRHAVTWNGRDDFDRALASGVYLARFTANGERRSQRLVLLK